MPTKKKVNMLFKPTFWSLKMYKLSLRQKWKTNLRDVRKDLKESVYLNGRQRREIDFSKDNC